jgi:putative membrane protein
MSAAPYSPAAPAPNEPSPSYCGPASGRWFPWVPLGIVAAFVGVWLILLALGVGRLGPWPGPVPWFWPLFPLGFVLFLFLVFGLLRWAFWGRRWSGGYFGYPGSSATEVLRVRYARGEISREEFEEKRRILGRDGPG